MAFGKDQYVQMAAQMCLSIKYYNSDLKVVLVADGSVNKLTPFWYSIFDKIIPIKPEHLYVDNVMEAGFAKSHAYEYSPFDKTIYLDVDGICIKDLTPLFDTINKFYATEVIGRGGIKDDINYSHWATNKDIWDWFELKDSDSFCATQSSFQYFEKSKEMDQFYERLIMNFSYPKEKLKNQWGECMPDELIISGTCAQFQHDPGLDGKIVFFGHYHDKRNFHEIADTQYINSLYGNGKGRTLVKPKYKEWYTRHIINICRKYNVSPIAKAHRLMKGKHVG